MTYDQPKFIKIPVSMLGDKSITLKAKFLYGLMAPTTEFKKQRFSFWASELNIAEATLHKYMVQLVDSRYVHLRNGEYTIGDRI